jgi:hypothetical protein
MIPTVIEAPTFRILVQCLNRMRHRVNLEYFFYFGSTAPQGVRASSFKRFFITEMKGVYSVVRTGSLNKTACALPAGSARNIGYIKLSLKMYLIYFVYRRVQH